DPGLLSVRAAFPRLAMFEREHGSVMRGMSAAARQRRRDAKARGEEARPMRMWSFPEGLGLLIDTLTGRLRRPPLLGVTARRVERSEGGWLVVGEGSDRWPADAVALTCPAYQQAALLADLDPPLADELASIAYNRIAVVALGYRRAEM